MKELMLEDLYSQYNSSIYLAALSYFRDESIMLEICEKIKTEIAKGYKLFDEEHIDLCIANVIHDVCFKELSQRAFGYDIGKSRTRA